MTVKTMQDNAERNEKRSSVDNEEEKLLAVM